MLTVLALAALACYLAATVKQWQFLQQGTKPNSQAKLAGAAGWLLHTLALYLQLHHDHAINLAVFNVASLISWLVAGIVLLSSLRQSIDNLYLAVFPLAGLMGLLSVLVPETASARPYSGGLIAHILLSILAYSIFTIAVLQALLLQLQERALKGHGRRALINSLPPLQTMERLLFEMIGTGLVLLSAALITGFLFVDDLFAQQLVHKTVLSIIAWLLYSILLIGRWQFGWRSRTALRWIVGGFGVLAFAFFGSKIVLELFINS
ncbi:MAG: cytochrome c biogenesis protein CcsA [Marinobacterium sp.]|nr:cytochrome c biogenesis protein CcsA [Marinobacterium sp.]